MKGSEARKIKGIVKSQQQKSVRSEMNECTRRESNVVETKKANEHSPALLHGDLADLIMRLAFSSSRRWPGSCDHLGARFYAHWDRGSKLSAAVTGLATMRQAEL
jgi:hypothetical protein